jgi:acid phosphatase (class A)
MRIFRQPLLMTIAFLLVNCGRNSTPASPQPDIHAVAAKGYNPIKSIAKLDLEYVLALQASRTPDDCSRATTEINPGVEAFFGPAFGPLSQDEVNLWGDFLTKVLADGSQITDREKKFWNIPRPGKQSDQVQSCVPMPSSPSYPSGHSMGSHLMALVLASLDSSRADAFEGRADQVAHDRVVAGVHFPSDIEGGKRLAERIFHELMKNPEFRADLQNLAVH